MVKLFNKLILVFLVVMTVTVATGTGVIWYDHNVVSSTNFKPAANIIDSGSYINISAENGWAIGQAYNFTVTSNSTLTGAWNSTKQTSVAIWYGYPNKSSFPNITNGTTLISGETVDVTLVPGQYAIVFQTLSFEDSIIITRNFTLKK